MAGQPPHSRKGDNPTTKSGVFTALWPERSIVWLWPPRLWLEIRDSQVVDFYWRRSHTLVAGQFNGVSKTIPFCFFVFHLKLYTSRNSCIILRTRQKRIDQDYLDCQQLTRVIQQRDATNTGGKLLSTHWNWIKKQKTTGNQNLIISKIC